MFPLESDIRGKVNGLFSDVRQSETDFPRKFRYTNHVYIGEGNGRVVITPKWLPDESVVKFAKKPQKGNPLTSGVAQNTLERKISECSVKYNDCVLPVIDSQREPYPSWVIQPKATGGMSMADEQKQLLFDKLKRSCFSSNELRDDDHIGLWEGSPYVIDYGYLGSIKSAVKQTHDGVTEQYLARIRNHVEESRCESVKPIVM